MNSEQLMASLWILLGQPWYSDHPTPSSLDSNIWSWWVVKTKKRGHEVTGVWGNYRIIREELGGGMGWIWLKDVMGNSQKFNNILIEIRLIQGFQRTGQGLGNCYKTYLVSEFLRYRDLCFFYCIIKYGLGLGSLYFCITLKSDSYICHLTTIWFYYLIC